MRSVVLSFALFAVALLPRPAQAVVVLGWQDVRDRIADGEPDTRAISTRNLAMQLDWLRSHGYVPVSAQAVRDARAGRATLPPKAVLLTFDGGYRSTYTHALPLLRAFGYPALVGLPTERIGRNAAGVRVGARTVPGDAFLSWDEAKALHASGLVEFATQGQTLATPVPADPQGDRLPAATARRWAGGYETDPAYRERLRSDLAASIEAIQRATGQRPQAVIWPDGGNATARTVAESLGLPLAIGADGRSGTADLRHAGATRIDSEPGQLMRLVMHENPGAGDVAYELRRDIRRDGLRAVRVALDDVAGADAAATARNVDALVERIRSIRPSHVFLQATSDTNGDGRADAAYFPAPGLAMRDDLLTHVAARLAARADVRVLAWLSAADAALAEPLASIAPVDGVVIAGDASGVAPIRGRPELVVVHALPAGAAPTATDAGFDFTALMLPADARPATVDRIVADIAAAGPGALDRTIFVIDATALDGDALEALSRRVVASGGRHVAYSQDIALKDQPPLDPARAAISARAFPYLER
ncbi:MAG TPA: poly-beta-1,6-N-acetyl-D-glucosamine N-deacetylase PgaB [Lysobacter sp.]|nr:poly-beta-1,6-N-acetyl-D-glucosamine N-deacetylase PgaB [Lysobacter sp.]